MRIGEVLSEPGFALALAFILAPVLGIVASVVSSANMPKVAVLNATATCDSFDVVLRFKGNVSGVFVEYWPLYSDVKLRSVGICNGTRSDLAHFARGQVAVCHFPATLPNGTRYSLAILTVDDQGYTWRLETVGPLRVVCRP